MVRWQGTTTERGYGAPHRAERELRLALYRPGDRCAMGGELMRWWPPDVARNYLDLPHDHVNGGYLPGLACRKHNRADGTIRGNKARVTAGAKVPSRPGDVRCKTCGRVYNRAARSCAICGVHYHPSGPTVRTCGRTCGVVLQQRNRLARGWIPRDQRPKPPRKPRPPGPVASGQRAPRNGWPAVSIETYNCRYCGELAVRRSNARQLREVCDARLCQIARLQANNIRVRQGLSKEQADAQMAEMVRIAMAKGWQGGERAEHGGQRSRWVTTLGTATMVQR